MKSLPLFSLAALFIASAPASADDKVDLKMEWQVGKTYVQTMTMEQKMKIPGQDQDMDMKMKMVLSMKAAKGKKAGHKNLDVLYEEMDISVAVDGKPMPKDPSLESLKGLAFTMIVDANGKVTGVEGLDESLKGYDPKLAEMMNEKQMKSMFDQIGLQGLPDKPVGKGDSWDFNMDMPVPGMKISMKGESTHEGEATVGGKKCVLIKADGDFDMQPAAKEDGKEETEEEKTTRETMEKVGMKIQEAAVIGSTYYDPILKMFVKNEFDISMKMVMKNPETGDAIEMPLKARVLATIEVQDEKAKDKGKDKEKEKESEKEKSKEKEDI